MRAAALPLVLVAAACSEPANNAQLSTGDIQQIETGLSGGELEPAPATGSPIPPVDDPPASPPGTDPSESAEAAANTVRTYYDLIGRGRYRQAWALWDDGGRASGMSPRAFADSFAKYAAHRATIGTPGRVDAGAGQRYVTVPVEIRGRLKDGDRPVRMAGPVTLHRAADIPGATAEQRSWRISASGVRPRPGAEPPPETPEIVTARYRCEGGLTLNVRFDNQADTATLRSGGRRIAVLEGQRPASGIWYRGEGHELRGKGREARYTAPDAAPIGCRAD